MVEAILKEIDLRKDYLFEAITTIYFGGGTPSLLKSEHISRIVETLGENFDTSKVSEITLEANPEDVNIEKVGEWRNAGINRVSLGIQSLDDEVLAALNRAHNARQATRAIELLREASFNNLTIDLMYGLPGQTIEQWKKNLREIIRLGIPHISSYALTIEPKTVFGHRERKSAMALVSDEDYQEQYMLMCDELGAAGYEHYEVSNFAQPGFRSQHNQLYWHGEHYLGIGPGAHSYNGLARYFNQSNNPGYIRSVNDGQAPGESEFLTAEQKFNEYLLTRLRTRAGIDLRQIKSHYGIDIIAGHKKYLDTCVTEKLAYLEKDRFILTDKGFFLSDAIILELMK